MSIDEYLKSHIDETSNNILYVYDNQESARRGFEEYIKNFNAGSEINNVNYKCFSTNSRSRFIVIDNIYIYFRSVNEYHKIIGLRFKEYKYR